jgi:DNA polymerase III subunit delta'
MPFGEICGQERPVAALRRAWAAGRLAQGYCFAGPPGVGKRTTALALAQAVNCLSPLREGAGAPDACGRCRACVRIAAGQHPDVAVLTPAEDKTVITIEQVRDVAARAGMRAYEGFTQVWILDPAERMSEEAANAFLKTLEEPTGTRLFILLTATFTALLPTIRSRCQEVRFTPLDETHLRALLERRGRDPGEAAAAAAAAGGSAERALDPDLADLRAAQGRLVAEVWRALDSVPGVLDQAERLAKDKVALEHALEALLAFTREVAVARVAEADPAFVSAERRVEVDKIAGGISLDAVLEIHEAQREAQQALAWRAQPRLAAERMLLKMRQAVGKR